MPHQSPDIRLLVSAATGEERERLETLCRHAGFHIVHALSLDALRDFPLHLWDVVVVKLRSDDLPTWSELYPALATIPVIITGTEDTIKQCLSLSQGVPPAGVLVEPLTEPQLRVTLAAAQRRSEYLRTLSAHAQWLGDVLNSIGDAVIVTDTEGRVEFLNPAAEQLTGWSLAEARHRPLEEVFVILNEETRQPVENPVRRVLREGRVVGLANHTILRRRTGEELAVDDSGAPITDATGRLHGAVLVFRDVTELRTLQRRQQHALALRQRLLQLLHTVLELRSEEELLSEAVNALASLLPLELACFYVLESEQLIPRWRLTTSPQIEPLASSPIPLHGSLLGSIAQRGTPEVVNDAHRDPRSYYPEGFTPTTEHFIGIPLSIGEHRAVLAVARYSEQPFSEEEFEIVQLFARFVQLGLLNAHLWDSLRQSEAQYRSLLDWLPVPVLIHHEGRIVYANHATASYLGAASPDELLGQSPLELVAPEDREITLTRVQALYRGEITAAPPRHTILLRRDGSRLEAVVAATLVSYQGQRSVLVVGVDVTERERLLHQLQRERAAFHIVATAALQSQTVSELCHYFLTEACRELGFAGGSVRLLQGELLVPIALYGPFPAELFPAVPVSDERIIAAHVARTQQPIVAPDVAAYPFSEAHRQRLQGAGMAAVLSYPILDEHGAILGTFQLFHPTPMELPADTHDFLTILATALGVGIERLRLQEQLRESEQRFRLLAEHAPIAITRFGLREGRYLFANREFERQSGYTVEEFDALPDRELIEMIYPDDRERIFRFWREWQQAGFPGVQRIDYRIINRHGELVWLDTYLYAERRADGSIESIVQLCADITPLKRAEAALLQALQEDFRRTVQNLHAIVFRLRRRADGTVVYVLREGKLAGEETSSRLYDIPLHELPEHLQLPADAIARAFAGERVTYEAPLGDRWLLYTLEPLPSAESQITELVGTGVDISQRKELERSLAESEHRYRTLLECLPVGVLEVFYGDDRRQYNLYSNPAFTHITGYTAEELSTISGGALIHPDDREWVLQRWSEWLRSPETTLHLEYRSLRKDGTPYWLELYALKIRQHDGWRIVEVGTDITERKEAEARIQHLASFPELAPIPIVEFTADGHLTYANPTARQSLPIAELSPEHPWIADIWEKLPELQEHPDTPWVRELVLGDRAWLQHIFWLPTHGRLQIYAPEISVQYFLRRQLQEALEHEQALAATRSRFMSTIAHEFRTPLAGIQLSVELLQNYFERLSPAERRNELSNIAARLQDLNTLVTDFLTQSALDTLRHSLSFEPVSVQDICHEAASRIQPLLQSKAQTLELQLPERQLHIRGDPKVLRFVLLNLLTNASKYSGAHQPIHLRVRSELGTVVVEVEDHGIGIPEEDIPRLFQPFARGSNTQGIPGVGLGLSMVREFVQLHRGTVEVRSRVGVGTTVLLRFPSVEQG